MQGKVLIGLLPEEHGALVDASVQLVDILHELPDRLDHGDVQNMLHSQFADRARALALHLDGVMVLAGHSLYTSALALLRTALEHNAIDQLLFLADRYEQTLSGVGKSQLDKLRSERDEWASDVRDIRLGRNQKDVVIERHGLRLKENEDDKSRSAISAYWAYMQEYKPISGKRVEGEFQFSDEDSKKYLKDQKFLWDQRLSWKNIKHNLEINALMSGKEISQLHAHYEFLGAYAHPVSFEAEERVLGSGWQQSRDYHVVSEIILLYVVSLCSKELMIFGEMVKRAGGLAVQGWSQIEEAVAAAKALTAYGWFPGQEPSPYDRYVAANDKHWVAEATGDAVADITPETIAQEDVHYYADPLRRLAEMHRNSVEGTTGFVYVSPWPRNVRS